MTRIIIFLLYSALALGANPLFAENVNLLHLSDLRNGDMQKLVIHSAPKPVSDIAIVDQNGDGVSIKDYSGKVVLLNFWATWCAPCRAEMPSLDALQVELGGDRFDVLTVASGRNPVPMIQTFFKKENITHLPILRDPKQTFTRANGVFGLPTTLILDPQGQEIARMQGDADWNSDDAKIILKAILK